MAETDVIDPEFQKPDPALGGTFMEFDEVEETPVEAPKVSIGGFLDGGAPTIETPEPGPDGMGDLDSAIGLILGNYKRNVGYLPALDKASEDIKTIGAEHAASVPARAKLLERLKAPAVPPPPKFQGRDEWEAFGSAGTVLAMFGSLFSRRPMTAAMNAAAASMQAIRDGDLQTFALQQKAWKDQSELALKQADLENGIIKTILDDDTKTWDQKLTLAKAYASSLGDKITASAAASGDIKALAGVYEKKAEIAKDLRGQIANMRPERFAMELALQRNPNATVAELVAIAEAVDPEKDTKAKNTKSIMSIYGVDEQTAAAIAYGINRVVIEPTTQTPYLVDTLKNTYKSMAPVDPSNPPPPPPNEPGRPPLTPAPQPPGLAPSAPGAAGAQPQRQGARERTLWEMAPLIAGPIPAIGNVASKTPGVGNVAPQMSQARSNVMATKGEFLRALANNPRFPVAEMERIEKEIELDPAAFDNPNAYRNRLIGIDDAMAMREANERAAGNDTNLPVENRKLARSNANLIRNFRRSLGLPPRFFTDEEANEGVAKLGPGVEYIAPDGNVWKKKK